MKGNKKRKGSKKRVRTILIFGESDNDCKALKHLVEALRPGLAKIETRKSPLILSQGTHLGKRDEMCLEIVRFVAAEKEVSEVVSVIAHRDCDAVDPAHIQNRDTLLKDMHNHSLPQPIAATPAYELEAWLFLWPQALAATRSCWNSVRPRRNTGNIANAKETLRRALRPNMTTSRCPDYAECDSPKIAEHVKLLGIVRSAQGKSDSFAAFVDQLDKISV